MSSTSSIYHITSRHNAERLAALGTLEPASLSSEGFVHCSTAAQVVASTRRYFDAEAELVLIEVDPELLEARVSWPEVYPGQRFPHVHGPLTAAAVLAVHPWGADDRDQWPSNGDFGA